MSGFIPPVFDPLESYAVHLVAEESSEVIQMTGKWGRFGPDHARRDGLTARRGLSLEAGDILAAIDFGLCAGILNARTMLVQREVKFDRLTDPEALDDEGRRLAPPLPSHDARLRIDAHGLRKDQIETAAMAFAKEFYGPGFDPFQNPEAYDLAEKAACAALATIPAPVARSESFVPGVLNCAKCDFRLVKTTLNVADGEAYANNDPDTCPNCNVPMWRVSWEQEARNAYKVAESQMNRALAAERALADVKAAATPSGDWYGYDRYIDGKFEAGYLLDKDQEPELREVARFNCCNVAEPIGKLMQAAQSAPGSARDIWADRAHGQWHPGDEA